MDNVFFLIGLLPVGIIIFYIIAYFIGDKAEKKYTKAQLESGEDKRIFMEFARSLFEQPEAYQYVSGSYIKALKTGASEYTYYFHSYVVAFNQEGELWVCPYQCQNHVPALNNKMKIDFSEAAISYHIKKKQTTVTIRIAGDPMEIWVEDIVASDGTDNTQAPFALDQTAEREQLNQVLPKFKELRKQQKG